MADSSRPDPHPVAGRIEAAPSMDGLRPLARLLLELARSLKTEVAPADAEAAADKPVVRRRRGGMKRK